MVRFWAHSLGFLFLCFVNVHSIQKIGKIDFGSSGSSFGKSITPIINDSNNVYRLGTIDKSTMYVLGDQNSGRSWKIVTSKDFKDSGYVDGAYSLSSIALNYQYMTSGGIIENKDENERTDGEPKVENPNNGFLYIVNLTNLTMSYFIESPSREPLFEGLQDFGFDIDIDDSVFGPTEIHRIVVGVPKASRMLKGKIVKTGAVFVYKTVTINSKLRWRLSSIIIADDGNDGDLFGYTVAIVGTTVLIGAPGKNGGKGAVYCFTRQLTETYVQTDYIEKDGVCHFGSAIGVSADTLRIAVGAPSCPSLFTENTMTCSGKTPAVVFLSRSLRKFDNPTLTTKVYTKFSETDFISKDQSCFGVSVSLDSPFSVVGAYNPKSGDGQSYVYKHSKSDKWEKYTDADDNGLFGNSVSVRNSLLVVSAPSKDGRGVIFVYDVEALDIVYIILITVISFVVVVVAIVGILCYCRRKKASYVPIPPQI